MTMHRFKYRARTYPEGQKTGDVMHDPDTVNAHRN